jgi:xylulokinase
MQMLSDALDVECVRVQGEVAPAFGAALLAGVGIGVWPSAEEASRITVKLGDRFEPCTGGYRAELERYRALYPTLKVWSKA